MRNHLSDRTIVMTAKFAGKCAKCGGRIDKGDSIHYDKVDRQAAHEICPQLLSSIQQIQDGDSDWEYEADDNSRNTAKWS